MKSIRTNISQLKRNIYTIIEYNSKNRVLYNDVLQHLIAHEHTLYVDIVSVFPNKCEQFAVNTQYN